VPLPIAFAALAHGRREPLVSTFGKGSGVFTGYRGFNAMFGCFGASLAAWERFASEAGYRLLTTKTNNVLLLRLDAYTHGDFDGWTDDAWCHAAVTHAQPYRLKMSGRLPGRFNASRRRWSAERPDRFDYLSAVVTIEKRCRENQTPFSLRINDECCPGTPAAIREGNWSRMPYGSAAYGSSLNQHARHVENVTKLPAAYPLCRGCG